MNAIIIILIILALLYLLMPAIKRWFFIWLQRRAQSFILRSAGIDPKAYRRRERNRDSYSQSSRRTQAPHRRRASQEPVIPEEYAQDAEFEDITVSEQEQEQRLKRPPASYVSEDQVSDAQWEEIKNN